MRPMAYPTDTLPKPPIVASLMARIGVARGAAALVAWVTLLGCGGDEAAEPAPEPAPEPALTVPLTLPTTAEQILTDDPAGPDEEVEPTDTTAATPTTLVTGLPRSLGIPGAGSISLGGSSSISNGFTVREVAFLEVVAFVQTALVAEGWAVQPVPGGPEGVVVLQFAGPGATGRAEIEPVPDGTVHVSLVLGG
jgi:hypothetical protein